ncbi:MAG TPA: hypothetical protein VIS95_05820, partial [Solirubrobacterales bacterium]
GMRGEGERAAAGHALRVAGFFVGDRLAGVRAAEPGDGMVGGGERAVVLVFRVRRFVRSEDCSFETRTGISPGPGGSPSGLLLHLRSELA